MKNGNLPKKLIVIAQKKRLDALNATQINPSWQQSTVSEKIKKKLQKLPPKFTKIVIF